MRFDRKKEMKHWFSDTRVLVCMIAALVLTIWIILQEQYYF